MDFRTRSSRSRWNPAAQVDAFLHDLADNLKNELVSYEVPSTLDGIIELAMKESEPMQLGRTPLTPEEQERQRRLNLCLYCGKQGHFVSACPEPLELQVTQAPQVHVSEFHFFSPQGPPGPPGPPSFPGLPGPPSYADYDDDMMSVPSLSRPDRHRYDAPMLFWKPRHHPATHRPLVAPTATHRPLVAPTVVSHQKIRVILPALSSEPQTSPGPDTICFDLDFHGEPILHLMEDKTADLLIKGQVRGMGQKGFNTISLQMAPAWHMQVNTTTFTFGMEQYSWTQKNPTTLNKDSISIHHVDRELEVRWGDVFVKILLHKEGGDYFLWPDIRGSNKIFTGLIGLFQGGHVEKQTSTSANLRIQGQVVPASRDTAVDYRNLHAHTVDCWLFQYQSLTQGNPLLQIQPTH
ncbi:hypothetical protein GJAV_G00174960 [Gymnothorax javanicus]|nr:hypothetical protein GJAV_G00174960 [Gymnothorax javanicus]